MLRHGGPVTRILIALAGTVALAAGLAHAHHSFAAEYFEDRLITISGEVVEFEYKNPHAWVHFLVTDESGTPQRHSGEWNSVGRLTRDGVLKDTLSPGDRVTISGSPGRNPSARKVHIKAIERPSDGWKWSRRPRS
jgi:hypothetical protein